MANRNPWKARLTRHAKRWPVPIEDLQAQAYGVLMLAAEGVACDDAEQRRKHILAYFQGLTAFTRFREAVELEARLSHLEALIEGRQEASNGHQPTVIET